MKRNAIADLFAEYPDALLADGFEDAFAGVAFRCSKQPLAVYDYEKCVEILMKRDGMNETAATEFFEFNVVGAWMGEGTPLFLVRPAEEE